MWFRVGEENLEGGLGEYRRCMRAEGLRHIEEETEFYGDGGEEMGLSGMEERRSDFREMEGFPLRLFIIFC